MKKIFCAVLVLSLCACVNNSNTRTGNDSTHVTYDASKADTTSVPNRITNSEPISTDTAAYKGGDSSHK